ncbi:MAG: hypothetical protein ACYS0K_17915 [Planctomycetota bacterium]|jgi:hypothetical protein
MSSGKGDRRYALAALSMWVWMACVIVFLGQAPAPAINVIFLAFAGWISVGVRRGERLAAAAGLLIFYGVAALSLTGAMAIYYGSPAQIASKVVPSAAWLFSLVMVLRAEQARAGKKRRWKWQLLCAVALGVAGYFILGAVLGFIYEARVSDLKASGDLLNELEAARRLVKADENAAGPLSEAAELLDVDLEAYYSKLEEAGRRPVFAPPKALEPS